MKMSAIETAVCSCDSIGRTDLRQCPIDHHLWLGDRRLTSIGSIIRRFFPMDPSISQDVLDNAADRGKATETLFNQYVMGNLRTIPAGTRQDAVLLFYKLQEWFDKQNIRKVEVQVLLGSEDIGGVLDYRFDGRVVDLKCTSKVEESHRFQVAAYYDLDGNEGEDPAILHVTERNQNAKLHVLSPADRNDWRTMLAGWRMLNRRGAFKETR